MPFHLKNSLVSTLLASLVKGYAGVWTLSEDKEDRKDGLWIWGLFEEPKYPFLYFYLDVYNTTVLASGEEDPIYGGEGVPGDRLNFR